MHILTNLLRPTVSGALNKAITSLPKLSPSTPHLTQLSTPADISNKFSSAQVVVMDLETMNFSSVSGVMSCGLQDHPYVKAYVVQVPVRAVEEQAALFDLGRAGVHQVPVPQQAEKSSYWTDQLIACSDANALLIWRRRMHALFDDHPARPVLKAVAEECTAPTVADLVERMYRHDEYSTAAKRRRLWKECQRYQLPHPETVWAGCRLLLLKTLLEQSQWTLQRIAFHLGYDSARNLSAMCRRRYGVTPTELKDRRWADVVGHVMTLFDGRA